MTAHGGPGWLPQVSEGGQLVFPLLFLFLLGPNLIISNITTSSMKQGLIQAGIECFLREVPQHNASPFVRAWTLIVLYQSYFCVPALASCPKWCLMLIK